jgi:hypothetical protein
MASSAGGIPTGSRSRWRTIGWGAAVLLLILPFAAMQFATGVNWTLSDFIVFGAMIGMVGGGFELAVRASGHRAYRGAAALALAGSFLAVWANLAVGIVGDEHNPWNQLFFAALLVGLAWAVVARFRARGMSQAMFATAGGLMLAFAVAMIRRPEEFGVHPAVELAGTAMFAMLFVGSAVLFGKAARHTGPGNIAANSRLDERAN